MIIVYILAGLVMLVVVLMLVAPKGAKLERTIHANVSTEAAYTSLRSLKNFDEWAPWKDLDPNQERGYKGKDGEVGSIAWWKGNREVGHGEQEIKKLETNSYIETELRFLKPFKATNKAYWKIIPDGEGCKVTWGFDAKFQMPMNIMFLFMSMESAIGKSYEKGLESWKAIVEKTNATSAAQ